MLRFQARFTSTQYGAPEAGHDLHGSLIVAGHQHPSRRGLPPDGFFISRGFMSDSREAILAEIRKKKVVYTIPGMHEATVQTGTYHTGYENLGIDIYYPPSASAPVPV